MPYGEGSWLEEPGLLRRTRYNLRKQQPHEGMRKTVKEAEYIKVDEVWRPRIGQPKQPGFGPGAQDR